MNKLLVIHPPVKAPQARELDSDGVPFENHNRARLARLADGKATPQEAAYRQEQIRQNAAERQASHPWRSNIPADWLNPVPDFDLSQGYDPHCGRI